MKILFAHRKLYPEENSSVPFAFLQSEDFFLAFGKNYIRLYPQPAYDRDLRNSLPLKASERILHSMPLIKATGHFVPFRRCRVFL